MTDMIEKVARALAIADDKDPDAPAWVRYPGPETFGICWRDQYEDKAKAAIEAMREPTDEMVAAAATSPTLQLAAMAIWQAMIDSILSEGGE